MVVVLVDGWPTDRVEEASRLARESGINIFFVTIEGPDENEKQNVVEPNFVDKVLISREVGCPIPVCVSAVRNEHSYPSGSVHLGLGLVLYCSRSKQTREHHFIFIK